MIVYLKKTIIALNSLSNFARVKKISTSNLSTAVKDFSTLNKSKRLMRLIYAQVHPDLFTNYSLAQKQNENSLKILRNLIDSYSNSNFYHPSQTFSNSLPTELTFFIKKSQDENPLKKIEIKLRRVRREEGEKTAGRIEFVFNQFIEHLKLPIEKFAIVENERSVLKSYTNYNYRVTYKKGNIDLSNYDSDYIDFEEFERWYSEQEKASQIPSLKKWLRDNESQIESKSKEARLMREQIEANKANLIKKWKLKNIIFQSDWSLKHFNSYLNAMKNFNFINLDRHEFEGFTIVLTNNEGRPGLKKNGHIHLNCDQVYEEWLHVLAYSKNESKLFAEIKQMEEFLSKLLKQIKICDNLDTFTVENGDYDQSLINSASYYHKMLHLILNNLTGSVKTLEKKILSETKFSHLQLTIYNVNNLYLNEAGQFMIGAASNRVSFESLIDFIKSNEQRSIQLYSNYVKSVEQVRKFTEAVKISLELDKIEFNSSLTVKQKLDSLVKMKEYLNAGLNQKSELSILKKKDLIIGKSFKLNDNGSLQIPWNCFDNENN